MLAVAYATGKASDAGQVTGDNPDEKGYPGPPGWGLVVGVFNPPLKILNFEKLVIIRAGRFMVDRSASCKRRVVDK